jgi:hypothetical protein
LEVERTPIVSQRSEIRVYLVSAAPTGAVCRPEVGRRTNCKQDSDYSGGKPGVSFDFNPDVNSRPI